MAQRKNDLRLLNAELQARLDEAEETLRAIRAGEVDAMVMGGQVYSLKGAETPYRIILESMSEGAATLMEDGSILFANRRLAEMLRTPLEKMPGTSLRAYVFSRNLPEFDAWFPRIRSGTTKIDILLHCRDGETIPVQLSASAPPIQAVGSICIIATDLTERKKSEERLRQSEQELNEAQRLAHIGSWRLDTATNETRWTAELFHMLGLDPTSVPPPFNEHSRLFTPESWRQLSAAVLSTQQTGEPYELELEMVRADGTKGWMLARGEQVRDPHGTVVGLRGMAQDVTERKQAEEIIHKLNDDLEQRVLERTAELETANKELEAFSYSVSHDLRAPLRAMDGFSRIALSHAPAELPAETREALEIVRDSAQQMGRLIDDLLTFSRLGRQPVRKQPVSCVALVRECLETLRLETKDRALEITIGALPDCLADPGLLRLVWINLLSNALKFTRPRAPAKIEIGCRQEVGENVYFVRDNGVGFKMAYAEKLFGVFQRLHRAEDFEGTGVGLATVQRIVTRHGGRIWAEAEFNQGATFYFTLGSPPKP